MRRSSILRDRRRISACWTSRLPSSGSTPTSPSLAVTRAESHYLDKAPEVWPLMRMFMLRPLQGARRSFKGLSWSRERMFAAFCIFHYSDDMIRLDLVLSVPLLKLGTNKADVSAWQQVSEAVGCGAGEYNCKSLDLCYANLLTNCSCNRRAAHMHARGRPKCA